MPFLESAYHPLASCFRWGHFLADLSWEPRGKKPGRGDMGCASGWSLTGLAYFQGLIGHSNSFEKCLHCLSLMLVEGVFCPTNVFWFWFWFLVLINQVFSSFLLWLLLSLPCSGRAPSPQIISIFTLRVWDDYDPQFAEEETEALN